MRAALRWTVAGLLGLGLAGLAGAPAFADGAGGSGGGDGDGGLPIGVTVPEATTGSSVSNAQLRWGLNQEAGSGAFAGGCNFLSAGRAGNSGAAAAWSAASGLYSSHEGNVTIVRAAGDGWEQATFDTRCLDRDGKPVSVASLTSATHNQVVIDGGSGWVDKSGLHLAWRGSFTVAFYGGMTYWSATDPVLDLDGSGNGTLSATLSGYGTSMEDMTKWVPIPGRTVVLAQLRGADLAAAGGFSTTPQYRGVAVSGAGQVARSATNDAYWGAFPQPFIDFQKLTGQSGYWLTTGGQRDPAKPASALVVNYDASAPAVTPGVPGAGGGTSSDEPSNPLRYRPSSPTAAAAAGSAHAAGGGGGSPVSVARDGGAGLIPAALAASLPPALLPVGGMVLAGLVSTLSALHLTGSLTLPWIRPRP